VGSDTDRHVRALRGIAASAITVLFAATAHTLAGGGAPSPFLVFVAATLAAPVAVLLVGKRASLMRTSAAVLSAQVVFHTAFALFGGTSGVRFTSGVGAHAHMATHMVTTGSAPMAHDSMSAAHIVAALLTIAALHRGERMLRALGRGIQRLLPLRITRAPHPLSVRVVRATFTPPTVRAAIFVAAVGRRGPPVLV
jgi:hypothetical protein